MRRSRNLCGAFDAFAERLIEATDASAWYALVGAFALILHAGACGMVIDTGDVRAWPGAGRCAEPRTVTLRDAPGHDSARPAACSLVNRAG